MQKVLYYLFILEAYCQHKMLNINQLNISLKSSLNYSLISPDNANRIFRPIPDEAIDQGLPTYAPEFLEQLSRHTIASFSSLSLWCHGTNKAD